MYASNFEACTWFNLSSPFFNSNIEEVWSFMNFGENYLLRRGKTQLKRDYYFQTSVLRFTVDEDVSYVCV